MNEWMYCTCQLHRHGAPSWRQWRLFLMKPPRLLRPLSHWNLTVENAHDRVYKVRWQKRRPRRPLQLLLQALRPAENDLEEYELATLVWSTVGMLKSFFLKNRLSFAKNRFFLDYRSDATVTVGCSNMLGCREGWCSCRGEWWRGRPTNRLDTQTEQTASRTRLLGLSPVSGTFSQPAESGGGRETAACSKQHRLKLYLLDGGGGRGEHPRPVCRQSAITTTYWASQSAPGHCSQRRGPTVKCQLRWGVSA